MRIGTDVVTFEGGHPAGDLTVRLPGGLIGLDAEGQLWASDAPEGEPLTDGDLRGLLGGRGAELGQAMETHARQLEAVARGVPGASLADPAVVGWGRYLQVPPATVGTRAVRVSLPRGVLAIGPELDVWRTVGELLWTPGRAGTLTGDQAAELLGEVRRRWRAFREEMVREWCPAVASAHATLPEDPRFA